MRVSFNGRACSWESYKASLNTETGGLWGGSCRGCSDQTPKAISAPADRGTPARRGFSRLLSKTQLTLTREEKFLAPPSR